MSVKAFWRWVTKPVVSVADAMLMATVVIAADAMHLAWHVPWWAILLIAWGGTVLFAFGAGFVKGFGRSVLRDWRAWRGRLRCGVHGRAFLLDCCRVAD